jgi:hypothetical protein
MASTPIYSGSSIMANSHPKAITSFSAITLTEANTHSKPFVFFWPTRSSTPETFFSWEETTSAPQSIEFMDFMTNVHIF